MHITISKRAALFIATAVLLSIPVAAVAGTVFSDVDDADTHIAGITFMKDSGVSVGCDVNNNYCPDDFVTRAQMGTFMYRLSGTDPATVPSVNAATVGGIAVDEIFATGDLTFESHNWFSDVADLAISANGGFLNFEGSGETYVVNMADVPSGFGSIALSAVSAEICFDASDTEIATLELGLIDELGEVIGYAADLTSSSKVGCTELAFETPILLFPGRTFVMAVDVDLGTNQFDVFSTTFTLAPSQPTDLESDPPPVMTATTQFGR